MTTWRRLACVGLVACLGLTLGLMTSRADQKDKEGDKKGTNYDQDSGKAKITAAAESIANRALANQLVGFGRKNKSPEALITAAEVLGKLPASEEGTEKPKTEKNPGTDKEAPPAKEGKKTKLEPLALLDEAKKMSEGDPHVVAIADRVAKTLEEKPRGVIPAPVHVSGAVAPGYHDTWTFNYRGGEIGRVNITGDGNANLALDIYDENNNYIIGFTGPSPYAWWTPKWSGPFTIKVTNTGGGTVYYDLYTN
jgi:hypothetical protein